MRKSLITFDYEVFLGSDSGSIENSLINPTDSILSVLEKNDAKAIFFVDATFLLKLKKSCGYGYERVCQQISNMLSLGCSVEMHFHPHWLDALEIEPARWDLSNSSKFRAHSLCPDELESYFSEAFDELQTIVAISDSEYKISAFRAGGWCIQPFKVFAPLFSKHDIKFDFSVLPEQKRMDLPKHYFDYSHLPGKPFWQFNSDVSQPEKDGVFTEVPISMLKLSRWAVIANKRLIKELSYSGDGKGAASSSSFIAKLKKLFLNQATPMSLDFVSYDVVRPYYSQIEHELSVVVGHPKIITSDGIKLLNWLTTNSETLSINSLKKHLEQQGN